jgi:CheY-like chemotaxis protein
MPEFPSRMFYWSAMGNPSGSIYITTDIAPQNEMTSHILLVDDNAIQAATRRMILEKAGYAVTVAHHGQRALDLLSVPHASASFGMLITDHLMPEMSGPELVAEVRARKIDLPVVVLSGLAEAEASYEGMNVLFRLKPYPPESLIALVRQILGPPMARTA